MIVDYFVIGGIGILLGGYLYGILVFIVIWYDGIRVVVLYVLLWLLNYFYYL